VKDSIGQALFGDNTYLSYSEKPVPVTGDDTLEARFRFRMPRLPIGDYSVSVAIAEGSQGVHETLHWIHDALIFQSRQSSVGGALVGLPMQSITLKITPAEEVGRAKEHI
jgi:lipopolysaccharide transport system ATP-binding protein